VTAVSGSNPPRRSTSDLALFARLLRRARPYWVHVAGFFGLSLLAAPLALLAPLPVKLAVDSVIGSHPLPGFLTAFLPAGATSQSGSLFVVASLVVIIALLSQLQDFGASLLRTTAGQKIVLAFRRDLFRHAQRLSLAYHDSKGSADSIYRIQWDAASIQYIAIDGVIPFATAALTVGTMLYVTFKLDWQLALVALVVAPVLVLISHVYRVRLRGQYREAKELESAAQSVLHEVLGAVRVVKAFGQETREADRFADRADQTLRAHLRLTRAEGTLGLLARTTTAFGTSIVLFIGVRHVQSGVLTLGSLLLLLGYLGQLYAPMRTIGQKVAAMQKHLASAERAFALLDATPDVQERPHARPINRAEGAITFRDVSFAYDPERVVLRNVSFQVPPGARVGIAGATGAGKTTLVNLLTRFYDPTEGAIFLDGVDVRDYRLADLRNQFALVLQDPVLFATSIRENIAYARPSASNEEIIEAAKAASADNFIVNLPAGYDTIVGERGMKLSGGERQRISLARAFLKNAPILVLDEPTSSVDVQTEALIVDAMDRLMHGRTSFMIAHRLSTLSSCDMHLEVADGRIAYSLRPDAEDASDAIALSAKALS
jgi:ATP-binding cassette, subfamily B, bacterial